MRNHAALRREKKAHYAQLLEEYHYRLQLEGSQKQLRAAVEQCDLQLMSGDEVIL